jgi:hypothetical protein
MSDREFHVPAQRQKGAAWEEPSFPTMRRAYRHAVWLALSGYRDVWVCRNGKAIKRLNRLEMRRRAARFLRRLGSLGRRPSD